jgi:succinate-semialdehyde dehydrogenase/glutarate-semialdehyde dehydrogenase
MDRLTPLLRDKAFVNGQWISALSGETFDVINPATREKIADVPDLDIRRIREAIDLAHSAMPSWALLTGKERSKLLKRWFDLVIDHTAPLAHLITLECGKPLSESMGEVSYGASFIEWFSEEAKRVYGDVIPQTHADKRLLTIKQPVGVSAAITPWNFPLAMITRKAAPALAAGCSMVLKPAESTPLTALALAELAAQAGIPPGVLNVVTTLRSEDAGMEFCTNPKIRKLSFTGSTNVGRILLRQCAPMVKKVSLELGGTCPFIIFEDADIPSAVKGLMASKFRNSGQTCVCANLILVEERIYDKFLAHFLAAVRELRIGNGLDKDISIGPLINEAGLNKVEALVRDAREKGAHCLTGGKAIDGLFFEPTILTGVTTEMRLMKEEIFGPVAPVVKFSSDKEAIAIANESIYGLAAYFYSQDASRCWRFAEALEYGIVGINEGLISTEVAPFGGIKQSGLGREGSKYGIDEYVTLKYICYGNIRPF